MRKHFAPVREARRKQRERERMANRDQQLKKSHSPKGTARREAVAIPGSRETTLRSRMECERDRSAI